MTVLRRQFLSMSAGAVTASLAPWPAWSQGYPSRPVRIVVGFPAGGPVDIAARLIAPRLAEHFGQPFVVENQPGESGNIATRSVVKAPPDGYTLLLCGPVNTINTSLFPDLDFDFTADIAPVAGLFQVPLVVEVNGSAPFRTTAEFLGFAKANPGKVKVAYAGNGTPQHVGIELFKSMAGVTLTLVPYLGSAPALADLLDGRVDMMFDPMPSSIGYIKSGKLLPLAVTSPTRSEALAHIPAMSEFVPGYEAGSWFGIGAPRGTPESIIEQLNRATCASIDDPAVRARLAELGATAIAGSSANFAAFVVRETKRQKAVIQAANMNIKIK
jgi:tripartite-type tricarboxylate transporter receptor subunit TctC